MSKYMFVLVLIVLALFMVGPALAQGGAPAEPPIFVPASLLLLGLVVNRVVESIKNGLPAINEEAPSRLDRWRTSLILLLSFVLGSVAMLTVFPTENLFPSAASPAAGLIFTGILVGGIANGWDFVSTFGMTIVSRIERPQKPEAA